MPSNDPAAGAQVTTDRGRNRFLYWYLSSLAVVGTALIVLGVEDVLDTWAFWVGGFLVVAGVGSLISMAATGGAGRGVLSVLRREHPGASHLHGTHGPL